MPDVVGVLQNLVALNTLDSLMRVTNAVVQTTLNGAINNSTLTIVLTDASLCPASGTITFLDNGEIVFYESKSSNTLTAATAGRGADGGPSATSHADGVQVEVRAVARHHTVLVDAIMQIEAAITKPIQTYITGLLVSRSSTTAIAISAGSCWDPSSNKVITYAGGTNSPSLAASKVYSVYLYNNAGTATIDVQQEDPPSTAYQGTARKRATGNGGRFIGWFLTNSSSQIFDMKVDEISDGAVNVLWQAATYTAPFRVLSAGNATTLTSVSLAGAIPRYVATEFFATVSVTYTTTAGVMIQFDIGTDGTNHNFAFGTYISAINSFGFNTCWLPLSPSTPQVYYAMAAAGAGAGLSGYLDVQGFKMTR